MRLAFIIGLFASFLLAASPTLACGPNTDCPVAGERLYRIKMPDGHDGTTKVGALVFAHGAGGTAAGVMKNAALLQLASELGVAVIAGQATKRAWSIPGIPKRAHVEGVDENVYFDRVVADAAARFPIDTDRLVMTGFSVGGMMVWNLICHRSEDYAAFVPVAGTFWRPIPKRCTTPAANIVHIHGDEDPMVPLAGRQVYGAHQGDMLEVLDMYAAHAGFGPPVRYEDSDLRCERRASDSGEFLDFCLFQGGHNFRIKDIRWAWNRFVEAGLL